MNAGAGGRQQAARCRSKNHAALIAAYRDGLGLAMVALVRTASGLRIAAGEATAADAAAADARWWCARAGDAKRVAAAASARLNRCAPHAAGGALPPDRDGAAEAVVAAARRLDVALYSDQDVADEAERIIARLDRQIEALQRAGDMKAVNRSYKDYRIEATARGDKVLPYGQWLDHYRQKLLREIAAALRGR